jgi:hypothetical protein
MVEQNFQTTQKYEAQKVSGFAFIAFCQASISEQPSKQTLHFPAAFVATQDAPIGSARRTAASRWTDQLYPLLREVFFERGAVVRSVADEPARRFVREARVEGLLDETYFVTFTRSDSGRYRKTRTVCDRHEFGGSSATSFSHKFAPLFAPAWVPSMNVSVRSSLPRSTRSSASACRTRCNTSSSTQLWNRRKHVEYGGYLLGMSAHGAPVRRIHRMPLSTSRGSRHGRPRPSSRTSGTGRRCSTAAHC